MQAEDRAVSKPVFRDYGERVRAYLDWNGGEGVTHDGSAFRTSPKAPLSVVLRDTPQDVEQLFVCGPERPGGADGGGGYTAWVKEPRLFDRWEDTGSHLDTERPAIRLRERETGRKIALYSSAAWFGYGQSPRTVREALTVLEELLANRFEKPRVLPTPAQTGLDLWDRRRSGSEYPVLPDELQDVIRSNLTQHRIELCSAPGLEEAPGFYYLDARWAYAGFASGLPVGEPVVDGKPEFAEYQPAFYLIRFTVPADWNHIGIFPVKEENTNPLTGRRGWTFPAEPGISAETWVTNSELLVARRYGWNYEILRRIVFQSPGKDGAPPEPLRAWRDNLVKLRDHAAELQQRGEAAGEVADMVAAALRAILLGAIGSFHRRARERVRVVPKNEVSRMPPEAAGTVELVGDALATYREPEKLGAAQAAYQHPEWSATIWGRTRAAILHYQTGKMRREEQPATGILNLPREDALAIRGDALYLSRDPGWRDSGLPGGMRLKGAIREPVKPPTKQVELNALRDLSERSLEYEKSGDA